ncbi:hypothetical protein JHK87_000889 [Glycine soja]|nr:hypothetical protein JHK87_000889 [Glycine soja]
MARNKVHYTYINNPMKGKATFKKRKNGFFSSNSFELCYLKEVDEITTLCDIQACVIIYTLDEPEPEITKKNENFQVQEVTLAIENGGETMTEGEQALVANVAAISNMNWSNDNNNEDDGDVIHVNIGRC